MLIITNLAEDMMLKTRGLLGDMTSDETSPVVQHERAPGNLRLFPRGTVLKVETHIYIFLFAPIWTYFYIVIKVSTNAQFLQL